MKGLAVKRKEVGWTQEKLAHSIGVQPNTVWRWESGKSTPNVDTVKKIASLFHCTIDELLEGPAEEHEKRNVIRICKNGNIVEVEYSKEKEEALLGKKQGSLKS